jgi:hypothetical protein
VLFTLALAGVASTLAAPGTAQQARPQRPCDIYAEAGTPCVTAHSTVRSLSSRYGGPLYQVKRADGRLLNIGTIASGSADAAAQDRFCAGGSFRHGRIPSLVGCASTVPWARTAINEKTSGCRIVRAD